MPRKYSLLLLYMAGIATAATLVVLYDFGFISQPKKSEPITTSVLGDTSTTLVSPLESDTVSPTPQSPPAKKVSSFSSLSIPSTVPALPGADKFRDGQILPAPIDNSIRLVNAPTVLTQGDVATFTWQIYGPPTTIKTTTVYMGKTSYPGSLAQTANPSSTPYNDWIRDFMDGTYTIPLTFTGNRQLPNPGTYFFRPYASIGGKHYWGEEQTMTVNPIPKNGIRVVNYPTTISPGQGATFTWEITGPPATTGFTVVAGGKISKPGALDESVALKDMTPYVILANQFMNPPRQIQVPLSFTGSSEKIDDPGVYYFRALAFINNKNIWSDEYTFTVQ